MDPNAQKEQFSNAFLFAVAAVAGCSVGKPSVDNDSIDWTISNRLHRRPKLDIQIKCTSVDDGTGASIAYELKPKNYADLILVDLIAPRILVLVTVPAALDTWLELTDEQMLLRRCAYWVSLKAMPESDNTSSITVRVPRANRLTVESLTELMAKISRDEEL